MIMTIFAFVLALVAASIIIFIFFNIIRRNPVDTNDVLEHPYSSTFYINVGDKPILDFNEKDESVPDFNEKKEGKRGDPLLFHSYTPVSLDDSSSHSTSGWVGGSYTTLKEQSPGDWTGWVGGSYTTLKEKTPGHLTGWVGGNYVSLVEKSEGKLSGMIGNNFTSLKEKSPGNWTGWVGGKYTSFRFHDDDVY